MSKEKLPPEEEKDDGYIEIPLPNLSGLKDKVDDGIERLVYGNDRKFDGAYKKGEGRLGIDPIFGKAGVISMLLVTIVLLCCVVFQADVGLTCFMLFMLLLCAILTVIGKY